MRADKHSMKVETLPMGAETVSLSEGRGSMGV